MSITGKIALIFSRLSFGFALTLFLTINCLAPAGAEAQSTASSKDELLESIFAREGGILDSVRLHRIGWNVQVIYTEIHRGSDNSASLKHHYFNSRPGAYFYPSSTVALPLSILALHKLHGLEKFGINRNTTMIFGEGNPGQPAMYNDPFASDGRPTLEGLIRRALGEADETACGRLYEFLGRDFIRSELSKKGYDSTQLLHRLTERLGIADEKYTNPVNFYGAFRQLLYAQPMQHSVKGYPGERNDFIGRGYFDDSLMMAPMNFSARNRLPLIEIHEMFSSLIFPAAVAANRRFELSTEEQTFLVKQMAHQLPHARNLRSDAAYDYAYTNFLFGLNGLADTNRQIRNFQVMGAGLGQLTATAYVADLLNKSEFMVSATIYCNRDNILNDEEYDYDSIGLPFFQALSKALMRHELARKRKILPDLSALDSSFRK